MKRFFLYIALFSYVNFFQLDIGLDEYLNNGHWKMTYLIFGLIIVFPLRRKIDRISKFILSGFTIILVSTVYNSSDLSEGLYLVPRVFYSYALILLYSFSVYRVSYDKAKEIVYAFAIMYAIFAVFYVSGGYRFSALDLQESLRFGRIRFAGVGELFLALGIVLMFYDKGVSGLKKSLFFILSISVLLWINMSRHVLAGILLALILIYLFRLKFIPKSLILVLPILGAFYYYINPIKVEDESLFSRIKGLVVYGEEFSSSPLLGFGYRSLTTSTPDFYVKAHEANIKLVDLGLIGALFQYGLVALLLVLIMIKNVTPDGFKVMVYLVLSLDVLFWEPKSVIVFIILASLLYEKNTSPVV